MLAMTNANVNVYKALSLNNDRIYGITTITTSGDISSRSITTSTWNMPSTRGYTQATHGTV